MLSSLLILWLGWGGLLLEPGQTQSLTLDREQSELSFEVSHMGFLTVEGGFEDFGASFYLQDEVPVGIDGSIQAKTIETGDPARDRSLISDSYLDAAQFPEITFASTELLHDADQLTVTGKLTIKEQEAEIAIRCQLTRMQTESWLLEASTIIKRQAFGLDFGAMDALVGNEIKVRLRLVFSIEKH